MNIIIFSISSFMYQYILFYSLIVIFIKSHFPVMLLFAATFLRHSYWHTNKQEKGPRDVILQFRYLAAPPKKLVGFPASTWLFTTVAPASEASMPCFGLFNDITLVVYSHACRLNIHKNKINSVPSGQPWKHNILWGKTEKP